MASYRNENRPDSGDLLSWIITIVLLVSPVWPIGLILLLRKLTEVPGAEPPATLMISSGREALSPARRECPAPSGRRLRWGGSMWAAAPGRAGR